MYIRISLLMLALAILVGAPSLLAWTSPTQPAPNGNVAAPVNTGTVSQVKNAGLGVNSLAVFGNAQVTGNLSANVFLYTSDGRLKENVTTAPGLAALEQLHGVQFDWKSNGRRDYGLIAQEVEQVLPELVHTNAAGIKSVEYANIVAVLIEAVKEQQAEIDALQAAVGQ